jgi:hypothetical protein
VRVRPAAEADGRAAVARERHAAGVRRAVHRARAALEIEGEVAAGVVDVDADVAGSADVARHARGSAVGDGAVALGADGVAATEAERRVALVVGLAGAGRADVRHGDVVEVAGQAAAVHRSRSALAVPVTRVAGAAAAGVGDPRVDGHVGGRRHRAGRETAGCSREPREAAPVAGARVAGELAAELGAVAADEAIGARD